MKFYLVATKDAHIPTWWPRPFPRRLQVYRMQGNPPGWWTLCERQDYPGFAKWKERFINVYPGLKASRKIGFNMDRGKLSGWKIERVQ